MSLHIFLAVYAAALLSPRENHGVHERRAAKPLDFFSVSPPRIPIRCFPCALILFSKTCTAWRSCFWKVCIPNHPSMANTMCPLRSWKPFPRAVKRSTVTHWLVKPGFSRDRLCLSANEEWMHVDATTAEAENVLNAEYYVYAYVKQFGASSFVMNSPTAVLTFSSSAHRLFQPSPEFKRFAKTQWQSQLTYCAFGTHAK